MTLPTIHDATGYGLDAHRRDLASKRDLHYHQIKFGWGIGAAAAAAACLVCGIIGLTSDGPVKFILVVAIAAGIFANSALKRSRAAAMLQLDRVYLPSLEGHDPGKAIDAVDTMISAIKTRDRNLQKTVNDAVSRLQRLRPGTPLSHLERYGYYPSRPSEWSGDNRVVISKDEDPFEKHWGRMSKALDRLRTLLHGDTVVTERQVDEALAKLIAPMRAVLRTTEADTSILEYIPKGTAKPKLPKATAQARIDSGAPDASMLPAPHAADALTPVDSRLNAAATMTAASLRTLMLAFGQANPGLFLGDDQQTGRLLVDRHLPELVAAYAVAHDAASGEERDLVRAEFAKSLATIRDTLDGIMSRHVQAARQALEDQGRFIEARHGPDQL